MPTQYVGISFRFGRHQGIAEGVSPVAHSCTSARATASPRCLAAKSHQVVHANGKSRASAPDEAPAMQYLERPWDGETRGAAPRKGGKRL